MYLTQTVHIQVTHFQTARDANGLEYRIFIVSEFVSLDFKLQLLPFVC